MSVARLWSICRHDLLHFLRRPLIWIWALIVFLCALGLSTGNMTIEAGDSATGGLQAHITSAFANAFELALLGGLFYTFFVAVAAGMEVIRDRELRVEPLLHSTPLRPSEYVWGKFLAALAVCLSILGLQLGLGMFFKHLVTAESKPEVVGELSLLNYLQPALILSVPLIVFTAGVAFWIGERTRRPVLVNLFPLAMLLLSIFVLWLWTPSWLDARVDRALMLVDPTGFRWLNQTWLSVDRGAEFYNGSLIGFDAGFFASRAAMLAIGLGAVFSAQRHLARSLRGARVKPASVQAALSLAGDAAGRPPARRRSLAELGMSSRRPGFAAALLCVARAELRVLRNHPGVWLFLPLLVLNSTFDAIYAVGAFDTPLLLTPGRSAVGSLNELTFTLLLFMTVFTVEGLRREESTRLGRIVYSAPVSTGALVGGKLLAASVLGFVTPVVVFAVCAILLLVQGRVPLDVEPYLVVYGLLLFPIVVLWNAFMAVVYALSRSRMATYAIGFGVMIATGLQFALGKMSWTWNWSLVGALTWTDIGPFEVDSTPLLLNRLMVIGAAAFFFALSVRVFPRREYDATRILLRLRPAALCRTALRLSVWFLIPVGLGIALQRGVNAGPDGVRRERWQKDYWRKNVRTWLDTPEPDIVDAEVALEFRPGERWFSSRGRFELANPHSEPLARFALTGGPHWDELTWTFDGEAYEPRDSEGLYVFTPPRPLAEGQSCTIGFEFEALLLDGFSKNGTRSDEFVLGSGVVLTSFTPSFVPIVGYQEGIGVDKDNRYDSREYPDDFYEGQTGPLFGPTVPHPVRVTVSAPEAYTMNSVGVLESDTVEAGIRTVTWVSDEPIRFFNVVGGLWDVRRGEGTAIYYHPEHAYNLDEMLEALDGARRFYSEWFHAFPWEELRVSEFAAYGDYAQGFPTNITFSEGIGFLTDEDERSNAAFFVTAHEAAHQWWGNILMPGDGPGGNLLSEGTSHFSTAMLFEAVKGPEQRIEFCKRLEERYNERRVVDSERELVKVDGSKNGDTTLIYDKMGWVCWMLREHMGHENILDGLRSFFAHYANHRDHPVLQDFVTHLRPFAPDVAVYDEFVQQWFFEIVLPEYELEEAETGDGEVRFTLRNSGTGTMPVEVAAQRGERFPEDEEDLEPFREARTTVTLGAGESLEVVLPCDFEPERIVVDPDVLVLQRGRKRALHRF